MFPLDRRLCRALQTRGSRTAHESCECSTDLKRVASGYGSKPDRPAILMSDLRNSEAWLIVGI